MKIPLPDARGVVAVVLAVGASVSVLALSLGAVTAGISPSGAALLHTILGTLIGAVATYLGGHYLDRRRHDPPKD